MVLINEKRMWGSAQRSRVCVKPLLGTETRKGKGRTSGEGAKGTKGEQIINCSTARQSMAG